MGDVQHILVDSIFRLCKEWPMSVLTRESEEFVFESTWQTARKEMNTFVILHVFS